MYGEGTSLAQTSVSGHASTQREGITTSPGGDSGCEEKWRDMGVLPEVVSTGHGDCFSIGGKERDVNNDPSVSA